MKNELYNDYPNEGVEPFSFKPESHLIGLHTSFLSDLGDFNVAFNIELDVKKTFHWKNGMYDKIRKKTVELLLPMLNNKPKGSFRITQHQTHQYNRFRSNLLQLEDEMSRKRWNRYILGDETDDGFPKWNAYLQKLEEMLTTFRKIEFMETPIIGSLLFGRRFRHYGNNAWWEHADTKPYIAFTFHLSNIKLNLYKNELLVSQVPYGDLAVVFEVDLYWWVNTLNNSAAVQRMSGRWHGNPLCTSYVLMYPKYEAMTHPYIKENMDRYGTGNVCFGSHLNDIMKYLHEFDFNSLYSTLKTWASNYNIGYTSPLNQWFYSVIGKRRDYVVHSGLEEVDKQRLYLFQEHFKANTEICKKVFSNEYANDSELFVEDHCSKCTLIKACAEYDRTISPDAVNTSAEITKILREEFNMDPIDVYMEGSNLYWYGLNITHLSRQMNDYFRPESEGDEYPNAENCSLTEQDCLNRMRHASLIRDLGYKCDFTKGRHNFNYFGGDRDGGPRSNADKNRAWSMRFQNYSEEFLMNLIEIENNKQIEERGL
tara:strand:- start:23 stop:1642 length:1620 start_codon:yes stop_codon:yes gene_type:complete